MKVLRSILLMLILLSLPILACSVGGDTGGETPAATSAPAATATTAAPAATATTAAPAATATTDAPEATATTEVADVDLGEELIDEAAGVSLQYPTGWVTSSSFGFLMVASDQALLDDPSGVDEGAVILIVATDRSELETDSDDPVEVLEVAMADFEISDDQEITDGPRAVTINGQEAATAEIHGTADDGTPLVATATIFLVGDRAVIVFGATPEEGSEDYLPQLAAIVQTIEISEPVVTTPDVEGTLVYGDSVEGAVTADSPSAWSFVGFEGETVNITVEPATDDFDLTVDVLDETGTSILDSGPLDASFGTEEIVDLAVPATGEYIIVVAGFGGSTGEFTLTLDQAGGAQPTGDATPIAVGGSFEGTIDENGSADYQFAASSGDTVTIRVTPEADFDAVIELYDVSGAQLESIDASFGDESFEFTAPANGLYIIRVIGFAGDSGAYTIALEGEGGSTNTGDTILLNEDGSVDANAAQEYDVNGLVTGDTLVVVVEPEGNFDAVITLLDAQGTELDEVDASFGAETLTYEVPADGNFVVTVGGFAGAAGSYNINISVGGGGGTGTTTGPTDGGAIITAADTLDANEEHFFPFTALDGTIVSIVVVPEGDFDVIVEVYTDAEEDEQLEQVDASFGTETVNFVVEEAGDYYFRVTGFNGTAGSYEVTLTGSPEIIFELAFGDEVNGAVPANGQIDFYFFGEADDVFTVNVTSDETLDAVIEVINFDSGDIEADADAVLPGGTEELTFTVATEGLYIIRVRGFGGGAGTFLLTLD